MLNSYKQDGDQNLLATFFQDVKIHEKDSLEQDVPITIKQDYVEIVDLSSGKEIFKGRASEDHKRRFAEQFDAYKKGKDQKILDGIPIEQLPGISQELVKICQFRKLYTIENVAALNEKGIKQLGTNGYNLVNAAKKYVTGTQPLEKKLEEQSELILKLQKQLEELTPKRTRKKKEVVQDELIDNSTESDTTN